MLEIKERRGGFGGFFTSRPTYKVPIKPGKPLYHYIPEKYKKMDLVEFKHNHARVDGMYALKHTVPGSGDQLSILPIAGFVSFLVGTILSVVLKIAEYHLTNYQQNRRRQHEKRAGVGPTYSLDIMQNIYQDGAPLPWVFGRTRTPGIVIQQYTDQYEEGIDRLNTLIVPSMGPIQSISKPNIDGNSITNYKRATYNYNTGTNSQDPLPKFKDSITTVGANNQLLADAAVITGGTASAERGLAKINFPSGCYHIDSQGDYHGIEWVAELEYRTTAGPGAWNPLNYPTTSGNQHVVDRDVAIGATRIYIKQDINNIGSAGNKVVGNTVSFGYGGPRWEEGTITALGIGYIDIAVGLTFAHTAEQADKVHNISPYFRFYKRRTTPFSIWIPFQFPTDTTYDFRITRRCPDQGGRDFYDAYLKEYQQISDDGIRYVGLATIGYQAVGNEQLTGGIGRYTHILEGAITNPISSATLAGTPAFTRDPGALMLLLIYNRENGLGNEIDSRVDLTMTATAAEYTVGETVTGPASDYQFRGVVKEWDGATENLIVEVVRGFPHGNITGATSGKVAAVASIDECYACDFPSLYNLTVFAAEQVPRGVAGTIVDANSNSGQKVLNVDDTDVFLVSSSETTVDTDSAAGQKVLSVAMVAPEIRERYEVDDRILINKGGAREESATIAAIASSGQFILVDNLANAHTALQADDVTKINLSVAIGFEGDRAETGTIDTVQGGVSITLESNLTYSHTAVQADKVVQAENRAYFDYTWDGNEDGWQALERIAKCSRAMIFPNSGSYIKVVPLKAESLTDTQIVSMANVKRLKHPKDKGPGQSSFKIDFPETGRRPNKLTVKFRDENRDYRFGYATREIPEAIANGEKIIHAEIELFGVSRYSQALREAWFRLKLLYYSGKPIEWQMGQENLDFECGDVFRVQHDIPGYGTGSGRIKAGASTTSIPLDNPVTVTGGEDLLIQSKNGTQEILAINEGAGTHAILTTAGYAFTPEKGDTWALGTLAQYRLVSLEMDQDLRAKLQALADSASIYTEDPELVPTFTETILPDPDEIPPDVTDVTLKEGTIATQDRGIINIVDVDWIAPEHESYSLAEIWLRENTDRRLAIGATGWAPGNGNQEFDHPRGICTDGTYIYVADERNNRILKYDFRDLAYVDEVGSYGTGDNNFISPFDLCTDGTYLFVVDPGNHRINVRLCADLTFHAKYGTVGAGNDQFQFPTGICTEDGSNVWITDAFNHRIKRCSVAIGVLTFAAHVGAQGAGDAQFERPMGIDIDSGGNYILVADTGNDRIKKHAAAGAMAYDSKIGSVGTGDDQFDKPMDVAIKGNWATIYVADFINNRTHRRDGSDLSLQKITGGTASGTGRDTFDGPRGLAHTNTDDNLLLVVEYGNNRVQMRDDGDSAVQEWTKVGETESQTYRINSGITPGETYEIAVVAASANRTKKDPGDSPSETITLTGSGSAPPDVANVYAAYHNRQFRVWWDSVIAVDLIGYEVRVGNDWQGGRPVYSSRSHYSPNSSQSTKSVTEIQIPAPVSAASMNIMVKAVTSTFQESATEASVTVQDPGIFATHVQPVVSTINLRTG